MKFKKRIVQLQPVFLLLGLIIKTVSLQAQIESPEEFVEFKVGEDKKLFGWETIVEYFEMLGEKSDRIKVQELGNTTLGKPLIMAIISSSDNLLNLAKYKNLQKLAANPRNLTEKDARLIARDNKVVVTITLNIHSEEIASSQESIELAYLLTTQNTSEMQSIMDNVIILLIPSLNPDGMQRIVDWYNQHLDSPFEGSQAPYLCHHYAGHDNNYDWLMMNLIETRLVSRQYYHQWFPEVTYEQHQMRSEGARVFLPRYGDPANSNLHPLLLEQMNTIGKQIVSDLQAQNFRGITTNANSSVWCDGVSTMTPWWHNVLGIRSDVASAQVATPIYFPKGSIKRSRWEHSENNNHNVGLEAWPGGWWRLRDIIDYELAITLSLLKYAAKEKDSIIYNFCKMNMDAINQGQIEPPFAFVIPKSQHDPNTVISMVAVLLKGGVEVHQAKQDFFAENSKFDKDSYVILLSQPYRSYVKEIFERQDSTDFRNYHSDSSSRLDDKTGWNLPLMMGVESLQIDSPFEADLIQIKSIKKPKGYVVEKEKGNYLVNHTTNLSFSAINRLLSDGKKVYRFKNKIKVDRKTYQPGAIYVPYKEMKFHKMDFLAQEFALEVVQTDNNFHGQEAYRLKEFKLGLYQPFTANMDEGWTRFILEKYAFPYKSIYNIQMRKGNLIDNFDVILIPDMDTREILQGRQKIKPDIYTAQVPTPYQDGITDDGVNGLREFVENGGILILLNRACDFAIEQFGLPVENVLKDVTDQDFHCKESLLEIIIDQKEPIAYGMPSKAAAAFVNSPVFRPFYWKNRTGVAAYYPDYNPLLSGWIFGEEKIRGLSAILDIPMGKGRVILIGFKVQNRAQTEGTYKLLFNAIHLARAEEVLIKK